LSQELHHFTACSAPDGMILMELNTKKPKKRHDSEMAMALDVL
jgi:hypothetical protein